MNNIELPARLPIRREEEITANWISCYENPLVSVCCATYNHEKFIEDAICGFLAQETNFPFEIIIRDDASDDRTTSIIKKYANLYPKIIKLVINIENQYKKGIRPNHIWPDLAKGDYLALCEGDDFWVSKNKLQKQLDILENNPSAVMSVALTKIFHHQNNNMKYLSTTESGSNSLIYFEDLKKLYFHTSTYFIKKDIFNEVIKKFFLKETIFGDTALRAILISYGPFAVIPEVVSIYRVTGNGIWTSLKNEEKLYWEFQVSKKLSNILKGKHKTEQLAKLREVSKKLLYFSIKSFKLFDSLKWIFYLFIFRFEFFWQKILFKNR